MVTLIASKNNNKKEKEKKEQCESGASEYFN